ncbi:DUF1566 domain-containing protein [Desulfosediminicola flagellatus]|uniref:Lcl domain-containing protein n=1 Tax=Desulfosediminicola flagellatus TaxID=2569541 RepID=UPI0010AD5C8E|nr:DUF1566 domain-containing protein [Desulfosediminicola flagellatus]
MIDYRKLQSRLLIAIFPLLVLIASQAVGAAPSLKTFSDDIVLEQQSELMWLVKRSARLKIPEDVNEYLAGLNQGEYSDWRLPTKQELYTIFSLFDLKQNGDVKLRLEGYYWLADEKGQPYVGAWEIGDQCGPSRTFYKGKAGYIRAVRPSTNL